MSITKTLLIFDQCGSDNITFAVLDGDKTHLKGVYVNQCAPDGTDEDEWETKCDELNTLFYNDEGERIIPLEAEFPAHLGGEIQAGTCAVIIAGFMP